MVILPPSAFVQEGVCSILAFGRQNDGLRRQPVEDGCKTRLLLMRHSALEPADIVMVLRAGLRV
jgi:hypothetical protein